MIDNGDITGFAVDKRHEVQAPYTCDLQAIQGYATATVARTTYTHNRIRSICMYIV